MLDGPKINKSNIEIARRYGGASDCTPVDKAVEL